MGRPSLQRIVIGLAGLAAIAGLACVPSLLTAWRHGAVLFDRWDKGMLWSPAFWIWLWATWMGVSLPWSLVWRSLPLLAAGEASARLLLTTLSAYAVIAMGIAAFWHFIAWGAHPLMPGGEVRWIPFWPWPRTTFTTYVFGP